MRSGVVQALFTNIQKKGEEEGNVEKWFLGWLAQASKRR